MKSFLALGLALAPTALGDYTEAEYRQSCRYNAELYERRQPNSTGSLSFDSPLASSPDHADLATEPWYMTLSLNDFRPLDLDDMPNMDSQQLKFFLSVPGSQTDVEGLSICYYVLQSLNVTFTGQGENSCGEGVVSDKCLAVLGSSLSSGTCILPESKQLEADKECGFWVSSFDAHDFSYRSCSTKDVPYVLVPEDYITSIEPPDVMFMDPHETARDFTSYDLRVRQTIPIIVVTSWNRTVSSTPGAALGLVQPLCLAPSNVTEESREPEGSSWPRDNEEAEESTEAEKTEDNGETGSPMGSETSAATGLATAPPAGDSKAVVAGASLFLAGVGAVMAWTISLA